LSQAFDRLNKINHLEEISVSLYFSQKALDSFFVSIYFDVTSVVFHFSESSLSAKEQIWDKTA